MTPWFKTAFAALALTLALAAAAPASAQPIPAAPGAPPVPTQVLGQDDSVMWQGIRRGEPGMVSIPNPKAGVMIQSEGELWRSFRNGPVKTYSTYALFGMLGLLALFFALRGRIRIDGAKTGRTIERFNTLERATHWLTAGSFIVLAVTGLNLLYGRYTLLPLLGPEAFTAFSQYGKYAHNYLGFAFMAGVLLTFVLWVRHNIPDRHDLRWLAMAGGLFTKGVHPPARKFNAGQKVIFWSTVLGGAVLGYTGVQLIFPFWFTALVDLQIYAIIHAVVAVVLTAIIIAHIYIGSLGMEGAFAAMGTGQVEEQWAREHHGLWVAEVLGERPPKHGPHHHHHASAE